MGPIERQAWEQKAAEGETEYQYNAFCDYLQLPKRGTTNRRYLEDLAKIRGVTINNLSKWNTRWNWIERAQAYDSWMALRPMEIAQVEALQEFTKELRTTAEMLREKGREVIEALPFDSIKADDALRFIRTGVELEEKARRLEHPEYEKQREQTVGNIRGVIEQLLTSRVGGLTSGEPRGVVTATERQVRFDLGAGDGAEQVCEVQALPGEVCTGNSEPISDSGPGTGAPGDSEP